MHEHYLKNLQLRVVVAFLFKAAALIPIFVCTAPALPIIAMVSMVSSSWRLAQTKSTSVASMTLNLVLVFYVLLAQRRNRRADVFLNALEEALKISGATSWCLTVRRGSITVPSTMQCATEKLQRANWLRKSACLSDFLVTMEGYQITRTRISVACRITYHNAPFEPVNAAGEHHVSLFEVANDKFEEIDADEAMLRLPQVIGEQVRLSSWYSVDCNVTKTSALLHIDAGLHREWRAFCDGFTSASIRWARTTSHGTSLHLAI